MLYLFLKYHFSNMRLFNIYINIFKSNYYLTIKLNYNISRLNNTQLFEYHPSNTAENVRRNRAPRRTEKPL